MIHQNQIHGNHKVLCKGLYFIALCYFTFLYFIRWSQDSPRDAAGGRSAVS